jgi:ATP-dependent Clp protease, protease subunit
MACVTTAASANPRALLARRGRFNAGGEIALGGARTKKIVASTTTRANSPFIPDEFQSSKKPRKVLLPGDEGYERANGVEGLSARQIAMMGLGPDQAHRRPDVDPFSISARASYRNEMPCEANGGPVSMTTAMSGGGNFTMSAGMNTGGAGPPPDLPSLLLNARIVYIGMPLLPAVTELVVAELLFLNYEQNERPGYMYIHSGGSINEKGEVVGIDTEAYAILDTMRYIKPKMHTVAVGKCFGNAALLLAAGHPGCRHALPNAQIMTHPPKLNRTFDTAVNVQIRANEIDVCEDTYMGFMSEFSGKPQEEVTRDLDRRRYFTPKQAIEYGLIDRIIQKGSDVFERKDYERETQQFQAQMQNAQRNQQMQQRSR